MTGRGARAASALASALLQICREALLTSLLGGQILRLIFAFSGTVVSVRNHRSHVPSQVFF